MAPEKPATNRVPSDRRLKTRKTEPQSIFLPASEMTFSHSLGRKRNDSFRSTGSQRGRSIDTSKAEYFDPRPTLMDRPRSASRQFPTLHQTHRRSSGRMR